MAMRRNMNRERAVAIKPSLAAALLYFVLVPAATPQSGNNDDDAIREAVARYQIAKWDLRTEVYFLSVDGRDPSDILLKRLSDVNPPVKKKSASKKTKDLVGGAIVEAKTEKVGVIFDQQSIRRDSEDRADVQGGYYCGSLCSASGVYHLQRRDGRWVVTNFEAKFQA
jgi:hypothetical protein